MVMDLIILMAWQYRYVLVTHLSNQFQTGSLPFPPVAGMWGQQHSQLDNPIRYRNYPKIGLPRHRSGNNALVVQTRPKDFSPTIMPYADV